MRWRMLRGLNARMRDQDGDHVLTWQCVQAAVVLHNLFIASNADYEGFDDDEDIPYDGEEDWHLLGRPSSEESASQLVVNARHQRREDINYQTARYDPRVSTDELNEWFPRHQQPLRPRRRVPGQRRAPATTT